MKPYTHDELAGEHSYVRMANQGSAPAAVTGKWMLYVTASGLFVRAPDGTTIQITTASALNTPADVFVTGDWILSTVTTTHSGWTNVSATYSNKFMRINATPLTTGGADTHTHGVGSFAVSGTTALSGAPDLMGGGGTPEPGNHTHTFSASVVGTSASGENVPAYVQVVVFQKN